MIAYEEVAALFHHKPIPHGALVHLVEYPGGDQPPEYYGVRFYRSNFDKLTPINRWAVMDWGNATLALMNTLIPTYIEIWRAPGVPE
jgi:hypothetical protein